MKIICRAPAKINLALHITGLRDDGYHLLDTLVIFTDLGDELTLTCPDNLERDQLHISGPFGDGLPSHGSNLVLQAAGELRQILQTKNFKAPPVQIQLQKNLPIASGIGGGSADAAAALRGLCKLWNFSDMDAVSELAGKLGADIPMCLQNRALRARGVGEKIEPLTGATDFHLLLVNPGVSIATMDIFRALTAKNNSAMAITPAYAMPSLEAISNLRNDLQAPAIATAPIVQTVLDAMTALPELNFCRMSGSGATCFGIFDNAEAAQNAAIILQDQHPDWWIKATKSIDNNVELDDVIQ